MKRVLLGMVALGLAGCGAREGLKPLPGKALPVAPYAAKQEPGAVGLLTPAPDTRPARSDNLIESSEERRSDDFDLPPN